MLYQKNTDTIFPKVSGVSEITEGIGSDELALIMNSKGL